MAEYIDREAVMKTAKNGNHSDFGRSMADLTSLREVLEDTPAADVIEVVHSKWIRDSLTGHISCSNCKMTAPGDCELEDFYESDFCPNCGAKMDGKENGK